MTALDGRVRLAEVRHDDDGTVGILGELDVPVAEVAPMLASPVALTDGQVRPWLLPAVYERLGTGRGEFLAELRPACRCSSASAASTTTTTPRRRQAR